MAKEKLTKESNLICVDGIVGIGKSSLATLLSEELEITLHREPVVNNHFLPLFYEDKRRWSFATQIYFLNKRFEMLKELKDKQGILDRSIYGDVIFARQLLESNDMSKDEYKCYEELLHNMLSYVPKPKLMIYLYSGDLDRVVHTNIKKRGRDYELNVEYSYWANLKRHYDSYFEDYNLSEILTIDVTKLDFMNSADDKEYVMSTIMNRLRELGLLETVE